MILDVQMRIGRSLHGYKAQLCTAEQGLERTDEAKIDKSVCSSFYDVIDNDCVADACKPHDRLIPFAFVNPHERDVASQLERLVKDKGVRGIKLHPFIHGFHATNTVLLDPLYEVCGA